MLSGQSVQRGTKLKNMTRLVKDTYVGRNCDKAVCRTRRRARTETYVTRALVMAAHDGSFLSSVNFAVQDRKESGEKNPRSKYPSDSSVDIFRTQSNRFEH